MRLAIPEFNGRISPVFDSCRRLLLVDTSQRGPGRIVPQDWSGLARDKRPGRLKELKVMTVLCGGITRDLALRLEADGIEVVPWVSGSVGEVLEAYMEGRLPDPGMMMPGHCRGRPGIKAGGQHGLSAGGRRRGKNRSLFHRR